MLIRKLTDISGSDVMASDCAPAYNRPSRGRKMSGSIDDSHMVCEMAQIWAGKMDKVGSRPRNFAMVYIAQCNNINGLNRIR